MPFFTLVVFCQLNWIGWYDQESAPTPPKKILQLGLNIFLLLCVFVISSMFTKGPQTDAVNVFPVSSLLQYSSGASLSVKKRSASWLRQADDLLTLLGLQRRISKARGAIKSATYECQRKPFILKTA